VTPKISRRTPPGDGRRRPDGALWRGLLVFFLLLVGAVLASAIIDRVLPVVGVQLDRPCRFAFPPNLAVRKPKLEYVYELRTNAAGLRSQHPPRAAPPDTRCVVLMGDGQTAGIGVSQQDTFTGIIERRLGGVMVVNAGRTGAHILRQARLFRRVAGLYDADVAVFCVSANDFAPLPTRKTPPRLHRDLTSPRLNPSHP
jgi:hypothetical protein